MTRDESPDVLKLLQVFWPIEWSPRMSNDFTNRTADELARMFKDYSLEEVQEVLRALARSTEKPPAYKRMLDELNRARGRATEDLGFRWEQYTYKFLRDSQGREAIKSCNVKIYPNGDVILPKGVPWNERLMRRQDIIDEDGRGIYDFEAHLRRWGPVWRERRRLVLEEGLTPDEACQRVRPEDTIATRTEEEDRIPEGFQRTIEDLFPDW